MFIPVSFYYIRKYEARYTIIYEGRGYLSVFFGLSTSFKLTNSF